MLRNQFCLFIHRPPSKVKIDCTVICQIDIVIPVFSIIIFSVWITVIFFSSPAPDGISSSTTSASSRSAVRTDFPVA